MERTVQEHNPDPVRAAPRRVQNHSIRGSSQDRVSSALLRTVPVRAGQNRTVKILVRDSGMLPAARRDSSARAKAAVREDRARTAREDPVREDRAREVREDRARTQDRGREVMTAADRRVIRTEEISAKGHRMDAEIQLHGNRRERQVTHRLYRNRPAM